MVEKFRNYIERGSWEEDLDRQFDLLGRVCWAFIILALIYFSPAIVMILIREVGR